MLSCCDTDIAFRTSPRLLRNDQRHSESHRVSHHSFALEKCKEQSEENELELRLLQGAAVCVQMEPLSSGCVYFVPCFFFSLFNLVFRNVLKAVYDWAWNAYTERRAKQEGCESTCWDVMSHGSTKKQSTKNDLAHEQKHFRRVLSRLCPQYKPKI